MPGIGFKVSCPLRLKAPSEGIEERQPPGLSLKIDEGPV
jgi:hypothetical protein